MHNKNFIVLSFLVFCVLGQVTGAHADNNPEFVTEVIVTGTIIGKEAIYQHVPRYSLNSEDIQALQPTTTADLLRGIPGLDVTQQGSDGGLTFVSIRGGDPNFTVTLIDGVKVDDPTNSRGGGFDFVGLDPLIIERIDVFYGGFSAIYGSDALGGIISVTTKGATSSNGMAIVEVGTEDAWAGAAHVGGPLNQAVNASISGVIRRGSDAVKGDSLRRRQVSLQFANNPQSSSPVDWSSKLFVSRVQATAFPIASGGDRLAEVRDVERRSFDQFSIGGMMKWQPAENWQIRLTTDWASYEADNDSPGIAPGALSPVPPVLTRSKYERGDVVVSNTISISEATTFGFGAEVTRDKGEMVSLINLGVPVSANFVLARDTWAVFGEAAINLLDQIALIGSLRRDDTDGISSSNARLVATIDLGGINSSATLVYSEAFKLPSLFAIGHSLTGNPDLKPERSKNYSLNFNHDFSNQSPTLSLSLYHNEFDDLVDFDPAIFSHVNRASAKTKGIDLSLHGKISRYVRLASNVGYLNTAVSDGTKLERRPSWRGNFALTWTPVKKWSITLSGHYNGKFYDVSVPTGELSLDGYTHIGLNVKKSIKKDIFVNLLFNNVLNNTYEETIGFSTPRRQARLAVSASF